MTTPRIPTNWNSAHDVRTRLLMSNAVIDALLSNRPFTLFRTAWGYSFTPHRYCWPRIVLAADKGRLCMAYIARA